MTGVKPVLSIGERFYGEDGRKRCFNSELNENDIVLAEAGALSQLSVHFLLFNEAKYISISLSGQCTCIEIIQNEMRKIMWR